MIVVHGLDVDSDALTDVFRAHLFKALFSDIIIHLVPLPLFLGDNIRALKK